MAINIDRIITALTFTTSGMTAVEHTFKTYENQGWAKTMKFVMPTFASAAPSGTFYILDPEGTELWNSGSKAQASTTLITGAEIPLVGGETLKLVLTAIPSGDSGTISVSATVALTVVK